MFIQTERTPNPATLKFLPGEAVMSSGTADFRDSDSAERSPLARRLFQIEGVTGVFFGGDFVSVSKSDDADWQSLKPVILGVIMEHFVAGHPLLLDDAGQAPEEEGTTVPIRKSSPRSRSCSIRGCGRRSRRTAETSSIADSRTAS